MLCSKFNKLVYTWKMSVKSIYSFHRLVLTAILSRVWKWTSLFWRTLKWSWLMLLLSITLTKRDWYSEVHTSRSGKTFDSGGKQLHQTWQKANHLSWCSIQKAFRLARWPWYTALSCWRYHASQKVCSLGVCFVTGCRPNRLNTSYHNGRNAVCFICCRPDSADRRRVNKMRINKNALRSVERGICPIATLYVMKQNDINDVIASLHTS